MSVKTLTTSRKKKKKEEEKERKKEEEEKEKNKQLPKWLQTERLWATGRLRPH